MYYYLFKLIHIIGFVSWLGGLFYLGRIFVHHAEALDKPEPDRSILGAQFTKMEALVWKIILQPALYLTWGAGLAMLALNNFILFGYTWFILKFGLIILLTIYHFANKKPMQALAAGLPPMSSFKFRMWNEVPTVFLVAISTLGVFQSRTNYFYFSLSLIVFISLIYTGARAYYNRRLREAAIVSAPVSTTNSTTSSI